MRKYGWKPELPDHRDYPYTLTAGIVLPPAIDLRSQCPPVYDQGELGSCTANALAGAIEFAQLKQKRKTPFIPSRLFIYYNERTIEGTIGQDAGAQIRDGIKTTVKYGACPETEWAYDATKFAIKPPKKAYTDALNYQVVKYQRLNNISDYKNCLASGIPFTFGFSVYESFESEEVAKSGNAPMPTKKEKMLGGHAVLCVGYDDAKQVFICRNSWGANWGQKGYFTLPYAYFTPSLTDDFWAIYNVEV